MATQVIVVGDLVAVPSLPLPLLVTGAYESSCPNGWLVLDGYPPAGDRRETTVWARADQVRIVRPADAPEPGR